MGALPDGVALGVQGRWRLAAQGTIEDTRGKAGETSRPAYPNAPTLIPSTSSPAGPAAPRIEAKSGKRREVPVSRFVREELASHVAGLKRGTPRRPS